MQTANQIFPDIPMSTLTKMSAGFDPILFRPDGELIRLAQLAIEIGIDEILLKPRRPPS